MAPQLLRNQCPWCKRYFNTYDPKMEYCGTECKGKKDYLDLHVSNRPSLLKQVPQANKYCSHCAKVCRDSFCSHECKTLFNRIPLSEQKKKHGGFLAYCDFEEENKKAERKRVFDDRFAERFIRGNMKDRI